VSRPSDNASDAQSLFAAHANRVAVWAGRLGGPLIDVEDVVQEVFITVHRRIDRFRGDASVTTWLYGITLNVVRQQRRKARRRRWFGISADPELPIATQPTPVEELERRRRSVAVYRVLDEMRETHRTVLVLAEMEGFTAEQISAITGLRVGTVWVRLHRARAEFSALARKLIPDEVAALEQPASPAVDARQRTR
jgi:RNA polymerase sigma-70 factor (ECF subfamily)